MSVIAFKIINSNYLNLNENNYTHKFNTRNRDNIFKISHEKYKSITSIIIQEWNKLANNVRSIKHMDIFNKEMEKFIKNN